MKTWKELADETTAENVATNLELARALGTEDMIRFVIRAVQRDGMLFRTSTMKTWVKEEGNPLLFESGGKYEHVLKEKVWEAGTDPNEKSFLVMVIDRQDQGEHHFRSVEVMAKSKDDVYAKVLELPGYDNTRHVVEEIVLKKLDHEGITYKNLVEF